MNKQEVRYRLNKRKARALAKRRIILLLATVLLITMGTIIFGSSFSFAQNNQNASQQEFKYYKSIEIQAGDSLWSIAEEYMSDHFESTQDYIDEIIVLNNLTSETIHSGQHLMVIYYDAEFK